MADINDKSTNKAASPEAMGDVLTKDALKAGSGHSRRKWIAAVVVLAALAAGGAWYAGVFTSAKAPSYRTAAVENGSLVVTVTAKGTVNPLRTDRLGTFGHRAKRPGRRQQHRQEGRRAH